MIKVVYIFIKLIEWLIFILVGERISRVKSDRAYWRATLPAIISFALVDGLRYGRMVDYWGYLRLFKNTNSLITEGIDPLFSTFMYLFKEGGLGFTSLMVVQSALLIYACFVILKPYRRYGKYAVPLLLPLLVMNENLTRWFMACSFLYIAFYSYVGKKYLSAVLYLVAAYATHNAIIPLIPLIILYPLYDKRLIPRSVVLVLLVFMTLFSDIGDAIFIVNISDWLLGSGLVDVETSMAGHLLHSQELIQGEHLEIGIMQSAFYQKLIYLLKWIPIIWFGYTYAKDEEFKGIYNITAISIILSPLLSQVELLGRYTMFMNIFSVVVAGVYYYKELKRNRGFRCYMALLSLLLFMYPTISLIFNRGTDENMLFIWDALPV